MATDDQQIQENSETMQDEHDRDLQGKEMH